MKEITLPVQVLKEALPGLNKIVSKKSTLPVLQTVRLCRDGEGTVHIQATDLDAFATYTAQDPIPGPVVDLLVPLDLIAKTLKTLGSESSISFVLDAKDKLKVRYTLGGSIVERSVSTCALDEFPPMPVITEPSIRLEPGFGIALRQALACCSEDSSRLILNSACLDTSNKQFHYVVGTNGRCLYSANSFCFDLKQPVIIPDSKFIEWPDFLDEEPASLTVQPPTTQKGKKLPTPAGANWLKLQSGRWSFVTREVEGTYPNWQQCVPHPDKDWTSVRFSDVAVKQLLLVVPNLPGNDEPNKTVKISITADQVCVAGRNRDDETWTNIPLPDVVVTGKQVEFGVNRQYLLNALKFGLNQLQVKDGLTAVLLSNGGKKMVIMPVTLNGPQTHQPAKEPAPQETTSTNQPAPANQPEVQNEERKDMPRGVRNITPTQPEPETRFENGNGSNGTNGINGSTNGNGATHTTSNGSAVKSLVEHVEQIKENLKGAIRDLNAVIDTVKLAEKERKTSEKEIEAIRNKLLQIQKVTI